MTDSKSQLAEAAKITDELQRASRLGQLAAEVGFDWEHPEEALEKVDEEVSELKEVAAGGDRRVMTDELGDILFAVVNVARKLGVDPVEALGATNRKFTRRFEAIEAAVHASGRGWSAFELDEMEAIWQRAKGSS